MAHSGEAVTVSSGIGMTCNPYKGLVFRLAWSGSRVGISTSIGAEVALELWPRLLRPILLRPSFAPIFFQPLLCELAALWRPPGDVLNSQSETGGVVGGVIGSFEAGEGVFTLPSVSPRSADSLDDEVELLGSLVHGMLSMGKKPTFGDRLASSELDEKSLGMRSRDRACLGSCSSAQSWCVVTDARNGPSTESFISSYTIRTASSNSDGSGGTGV